MPNDRRDFVPGGTGSLPTCVFEQIDAYVRGSKVVDDGGLDGGPIQNPQAGDFELDVETTMWGAGATHVTVDDLIQVRSQIEQQLEQRVNR